MAGTDGRRAGRTWPQRLLIIFNCLCILGALVTAGALGYFNKKVSEVTRVRLGTVLDDEQTLPGDPQNYLLVGNDDARRLTDKDPETLGRNEPQVHTDTIMILRIDPEDTSARLLSLPRDLWVPIAGRSTKNRINTAIEAGDAKVLARTIEQNFRIPIHHYVQVDWAAFKKLVSTVDGIPIYFPNPLRDFNSGLDIPTPGCHLLDPTQALAFARSRYLDVQRDGRWRRDPFADLGRINRQQFFIRTALERAVKKGARNPAKLRQLVNLGVSSVVIDERLRAEDIIDLGKRFRSFSPDNLKTYTVPVVEAMKGAASVVELIEDEAEPVFAIFREQVAERPSTTTTTVSPSQVRVQVLNGSDVEGQAGQVTGTLAALGFSTVPAADAQGFDDVRTTVRFAPGKSAEAHLVARYLAGDVVYAETAALQAVDVEVVTAADWRGVLDEPRAAGEVPTPGPGTPGSTSGSTTTTTSPSTTTTSVIGYVPTPPPAGVDCG